MIHSPRALILSGDGINCERETALAFTQAGALATIIHINDLLSRPSMLSDFQIFAIPGGFSFGDELGSGQILALKLKHGLSDELQRFVEKQLPILGICNGFQALVKLGLLPAIRGKSFALAPNIQGHFQNRWVTLNPNRANPSPWLRNLPNKMQMPMRHGEGRLICQESNDKQLSSHIALTYSEYVNGSLYNIAGLTNKIGNVLGLMPHPEANLFNVSRGPGNPGLPFAHSDGFFLFKNIVDYVQE
ncbi:MAG: phosphoribosylformylglycinamidine synthase subunit PurQ [Bdellovibrio sp.]|nr:phosphoribosylformylglycinamidine synthase subunit PurQ [Bdellovibrio sp.]